MCMKQFELMRWEIKDIVIFIISKPVGGEEACSIYSFHCSNQATAIHTFPSKNDIAWVAVSSLLGSFICDGVFQRGWLSYFCSFSRKCQPLNMSQQPCSWMQAGKNSSYRFWSAVSHSLIPYCSGSQLMIQDLYVSNVCNGWLSQVPDDANTAFTAHFSAQTGALLTASVKVNLLLSRYKRNQFCPYYVGSRLYRWMKSEWLTCLPAYGYIWKIPANHYIHTVSWYFTVCI